MTSCIDGGIRGSITVAALCHGLINLKRVILAPKPRLNCDVMSLAKSHLYCGLWGWDREVRSNSPQRLQQPWLVSPGMSENNTKQSGYVSLNTKYAAGREISYIREIMSQFPGSLTSLGTYKVGIFFHWSMGSRLLCRSISTNMADRVAFRYNQCLLPRFLSQPSFSA